MNILISCFQMLLNPTKEKEKKVGFCTQSFFFTVLNNYSCGVLLVFVFSAFNLLKPYIVFLTYQKLLKCRAEVCRALEMAEEHCELSMGMSGDFELAVSIT